jgi:hypothetical protein
MKGGPQGVKRSMKAEEVRERVEVAIAALMKPDRYLLENNLGERCIAGRLAIYLQQTFSDLSVDVEYNRDGIAPKTLDLPENCADYKNESGEALVVPDVIVHRRGPGGPNILVIEIKKSTNPNRHGMRDRERVRAFRAQLRYEFGALIMCETRPGRKPDLSVSEWIED